MLHHQGTSNIRPIIVKAVTVDGRRLPHLEGKPLKWSILPQESVDLDISWGKHSNKYEGRLVAIYKRGKRNKKTFTYLHTNLPRDLFSVEDVGKIYRIRWQIELLFKEWKSYSSLHGFDTSNESIAEGLIWASLLAATVKRFLANAAERVHGIEISTLRVAASARLFFDEVLSTLLHARSALAGVLNNVFTYFTKNTQRAHPKRDREKVRLSEGLEPIMLKD
ncbi:MAG: transposase [Gammaproteobacteria bacterium]|nr:transposase [Gammaproteobacteria bacterium]